MKNKTTSPTNSKRGCLCKDGETYSKECCEGELINQGIGNVYGNENSSTTIVNENQERTIVTVN